MDVVYILGNGSLANNLEILFSLRSLEMNMLDLRRVYIVGEKPDWIQNVEYIPLNDQYEEPWKNALSKIAAACKRDDLSSEFLLMNDDFFMLEPFSGADYPFYIREGASGGSSGTHSFMVHYPMRIEKELYLQMPLTVDMKGSFSPRSFYANFFQKQPIKSMPNTLRSGKGLPPFDKQAEKLFCVTTDNVSMQDREMQLWFESQFPAPSRFEKLV